MAECCLVQNPSGSIMIGVAPGSCRYNVFLSIGNGHFGMGMD